MKNKIFGVILIVLSLSLLVWASDVFTDTWHFIIQRNEGATTTHHLAIIGQLLLYLVSFLSAIIFSFSLLRRQDNSRRFKRTTLIIVAAFLIALELPVYSCESFPPAKHSFWYSYDGHLH
jgi:hypothetical protein